MVILRKQKVCFSNFTRYFSNNTFNKTRYTKRSQITIIYFIQIILNKINKLMFP
nr:MAG TPA: hypothetical protein [Caudoviricetes sp.]